MSEEFIPGEGMDFSSLLQQEFSGKTETETAGAQSQPPETTEPPKAESTETVETQNDPAVESEQKPVPREIEYSFTDKEGRKQKAKFDLSDTAKLQQQLSLAAGARTWQFERDQARKQLKEIETKYGEVSNNYKSLEQAWGDGGKEGLKNLVNLLTGAPDGFDKFLKAEVDRVRARESASPDELERMNLMEEREAAIREREKALKMLNQKEEAAKKAKEEADYAATRALIDPAFFEHSFDGKLGDAELEAELNEALWTSATKKLDALPEGTVLTPAMVKEVFAKVASKFEGAVQKQAEAKATQTITKKKEAAQTQVAATAKQGLGASAKEMDIDKSLSTAGFAATLAKMLGGR